MNDRYEEMYQAATRYYIQGETMESIAHNSGSHARQFPAS